VTPPYATKTAADTLREAAAVKPGDPLDAALREVEAKQPEMTFEKFILSLKLTWPKTRICQVGLVIMTGLLVYLVATNKAELATLVFSLILWILGVQKEQRVLLGVAFGATQHLVRQTAAHQEHVMARIDSQIGQVMEGVDNIRENPMQGGTPPDIQAPET
jgi:hypothetical protein